MSVDTNLTQSENDSLTFNNIRTDFLSELGQFRTLRETFGWRERKTNTNSTNRRVVQFDAPEVKSVEWILANGPRYQLKTTLKNNEIHRFDGFSESDFIPLSKHIKKYWNLDLICSELCTKGWNWGHATVTDKSFHLKADDKSLLEITSNYVHQVYTTRNDVNFILKSANDRLQSEDQLVEIRFFTQAPKNEEDEQKYEEFKKSLLNISKAKGHVSMQMYGSFVDLKVLVPAGRFNLEIFRNSFKLTGKSSDFIIEYKDVTGLYVLSSLSSPYTNMVISLSTPIRKGNTTYSNIVVQFKQNNVINFQVNIHTAEKFLKTVFEEVKSTLASPEDDLKFQDVSFEETKDDPNLMQIIGDESEIASLILQKLTSLPVNGPGPYLSSSKQCCFRTSYKADSGTMYMLESSFLFIPKPVMIVNYSDILNVSFGRTHGAQTKLFEFTVLLRSSGNTLTFSSVDRHEAGPLMEFFKKMNISVRSAPDQDGDTQSNRLLGQDFSDDDNSDEDFEKDEDEDDDDDDDEEDKDDNEEDDDDDEESEN